MLLAIILSPLFMAILALVVVLVAKLTMLSKPSVVYLVSRSFVFAAIGAVSSLLLTIAWIIWYEHSTGYNAGNSGPVSAALGQLLALAMWWIKKPD
jgi:hypothetical protein